jgi:hypothetical protein
VVKEQRTPVLPKGFYWVDVFGDKRAGMSEWLRVNHDKVKARATESDTETDPPRDWYMFEVLEPVQWLPASQYGFPTIGAPSSSQETVQRPDPEPDGTVRLEQLGERVLTGGAVLVGVLLLVKFWPSRPIAKGK